MHAPRSTRALDAGMHVPRAETIGQKGALRTSFFDFARAPILNIMRVYGASTHYTRLPVPPIVPVNPVQSGPHACYEASRSDGS